VLDYTAIAIALTIISAVWSLGLWINKQFGNVNKLIYDKFEQLLIKLEYHEKHDDARFNSVNDQLWQIRLETALKGKTVAEEDKAIQAIARPRREKTVG
jgi:hypothetical protein